MLSCTTVLHLVLVSVSVVLTAILSQRCNAKILLHLVPYANDSVTNGSQSQNIVTYLVVDKSDSVIIGAWPNHCFIFCDRARKMVSVTGPNHSVITLSHKPALAYSEKHTLTPLYKNTIACICIIAARYVHLGEEKFIASYLLHLLKQLKTLLSHTLTCTN